MKKIKLCIFCGIILVTMLASAPTAKGSNMRSKFYDFSEQLIDGEIKKPTTLYTDVRKQVRFDRLLKLKKSFLPKLFATAKERVFK